MTDSINVDVFVSVEPARAFDLFTSDVDLWWRKGPAYRTRKWGTFRFEPGVGGRFLDVHPDNGLVRVIGTISVWDVGERLMFDWRGPNFEADQRTEVEVRFVAEDDGTRVSVEHRGWSSLPKDHPVRHGANDERFVAQMSRWWADLLTGLQRSI